MGYKCAHCSSSSFAPSSLPSPEAPWKKVERERKGLDSIHVGLKFSLTAASAAIAATSEEEAPARHICINLLRGREAERDLLHNIFAEFFKSLNPNVRKILLGLSTISGYCVAHPSGRHI